MSIQGLKADARLVFGTEAALGVQTYPSPGDYLLISGTDSHGLDLQIERNGTRMLFLLRPDVQSARLHIRTGTVTTRQMVANLVELISLMSGLALVCVSDEVIRWTFVFREP
jgi:hypothetical protein